MLAHLLALAGGWAVATAGSDDLWSTDATRITLDNGLTVVVEERDRADTIALSLRVGAGSAMERDGERGCARLFEKMLMARSEHVPDGGFTTLVEQEGGTSSSLVVPDWTLYDTALPSAGLDLALFLESDRAGHIEFAFTPENMLQQRDATRRDDAASKAEPHARDLDALHRLMYPPDHPYHHRGSPVECGMKRYGAKVAHEWWRRTHPPSNMVLTVVGPIPQHQVVNRVRHWYDDVPSRGPAEPPRERIVFSADAVDGVLEDTGALPTVYLAWQAPHLDHADAPVMALLASLAGDGPTSPVHRRLVGLGLAESAGVELIEGEQSSMVLAWARVPKGSLKKPAEALQAVIDDLAAKPLPSATIALAKRRLLDTRGQELIHNHDRARALAHCTARTGAPNCLGAFRDRVKRATPEEVHKLAKGWLAPGARVRLSVVPAGGSGALAKSIPVELP